MVLCCCLKSSGKDKIYTEKFVSSVRGVKETATRAGEPEAGHSCELPGPGGIEAKSTATAAVGIPQSSRDHHLPEAFAAAAARFLAPLDSGCSILQSAPSTHEPLRKSGQTPEAGAPGLAARVGFLSFQAW